MLAAVAPLEAVGADKTVLTLNPQTTDDGFDLEVKQTAALSQILEKGVGGSSSNINVWGFGGTAISDASPPKVNQGLSTVADHITAHTMLLVTNLALINYLGTDLVAGDILNTNAITVSPVALTNGGTAKLVCATYNSSTNLAIQAVDMLVCSQPVTWGNASAVPGVLASELPYVLGVVSFGTNGLSSGFGTPFLPFGTVQSCTVPGLTIGCKPSVNTIYLYFRTRVAITNSANDQIKLTFEQH